MRLNTIMDRQSLINQLEAIVRGDGDYDLNIENFFERVMLSIESNGRRQTEIVYDLPSNFVREVEEYMELEKENHVV